MNLWLDRSLPVLQWVRDHEGIKTLASLGDIAAATGMSADDADAELERLAGDGLVVAEVHRTLNGGNAAGWFVAGPRLTGQGARALGDWPDGNKLITVLERMAEEEVDSTKKTGLRRLADAARDVGQSVISEMLVAYLKAQGHLP